MLFLARLLINSSHLFRAESILNRGNVDAFALEESQNLSIFFATNNSITNELKKHLEEVWSLFNPFAHQQLEDCLELEAPSSQYLF